MQARTPTLNQHIFWLILKPTLFIALGLLCLVWLMQSLRFLDLMINKGLSIGTFLHLTSLMIPSLLIIILPLATLAGAIYAFKVLNDDNELPALFSSGLARGQIIRPALWAGVLLLLFSYANMLFMAPWGTAEFKRLQHELRHSEGHMLLEEGTFNPLGDDVMVYLKNRVGRTGLNMLLVHDSRDVTTPVTWMAKHGNIIFSDDGRPRLTLIEGIRQEVTPTQTSMLAFQEHTLDIQRQIAQAPTRVKNAEERYMSELNGLPNERLSPRIQQEFEAEKVRRILWPLTPMVLILIVGAMLIQPRSTRRGVMRPVVLAAILGVAYIMLLIGVGSVATAGNTSALYGQIGLPFAFMLLASFFLRGGTAR